MWHIISRIGSILCVAVCVAILFTVTWIEVRMHSEYREVKKENTHLSGKLYVARAITNDQGVEIASLQADLEREKARLDVLDASVNPDEKRHQRLLQTRDAILAILHGGRSLKACGNLEPWNVYRMAGWFVDYTDRYGVPLPLALGVARQESVFCQKAVSEAGAVGTMQIMRDTAEDLSRRIGVRLRRGRTQDNIRMGIYFLGQLLLDFKNDTELAVKAYNTGPTNVRRVLAGELPDYYEETKDYWKKVEAFTTDFKEMGL